MSAAATIIQRSRLTDGELRAVLDLAELATDRDGSPPFSEQVLLRIRYGRTPGRFTFLAENGDALVGVAYVDADTTGDGPTAELVVHPDARRQGVGGALLSALEAASPDGRLRVWAHGRHPDAVALATDRGYEQERVLWRYGRTLVEADPLPAVDLPAGVRLRPFVVGQDEEAWVRVNNRAFATHPDQGGMTVTDITLREREPWFDPEGFLLAERTADGALVGFHWTKVHPARAGADPFGEVYVLGIDPDAQGMGLGPALTVAGLRHLRQRGLTGVILYVDDTNVGAKRLYAKLGFTEQAVDIRFRRRDAP